VKRALREVPLREAWPPRPGELTVTMRKDQWGALLTAAYEAGATLLEVDEREQPVRAFRRGVEK
jgi:hypothetical protein